MISKEMLSKILKLNILTCEDVVGGVAYSYKKGRTTYTGDVINIYELTHLCKKWILEKGYTVNLLSRDNGLFTLTLKYGIDYDFEQAFYSKYDELEVINKACEWILKGTE